MKTCPVIVIGHVDHGKTALVRALTGIETDRLPEEKARGLSIVPGFAFRQFDDVLIDFIDAPGHADFVRAMISGASGAQAALLVIAANEGVCAQTREHIETAEMLGIKSGIVAVTKADLMSATEFTARESELRASLSGTQFSATPLIFCSSFTGFGIEALGTALRDVTSNPHALSAPPAAFLPVDRVFTADGHGTIVTGTLLGAPLGTEDTLMLSPSGKPVSIRRIEVRGQITNKAHPGERTALNLRGLPADQIQPGDVLHKPEAFAASLTCDISVQLSPSTGQSVRHMDQLRVHFGSGYVTATLRLYEGKMIDPGDEGFAELRFQTPVCMFSGQRVILRSLSPAATLGGATILDPAPAPARSRKSIRLATLQAAKGGDVCAIAGALSAESGGVADIRDICRLARVRDAVARQKLEETFSRIRTYGFAPVAIYHQAMARCESALNAFHTAHPLKSQVPRSEFTDPKIAPELQRAVEASLADAGKIMPTETGARSTSHNPFRHLRPEQTARMESMSATIKVAGLMTPSMEALTSDEEDQDLLVLLIVSCRVIRRRNESLNQTVLFHADAVLAAIGALRSLFPGGAAFTTSEARAALSTTRKYIVPLLEYFDETGVTIRTGDMRYLT